MKLVPPGIRLLLFCLMAATGYSQQPDATRPTADKRQPATQKPEKPGEAALKPQPPEQERPAIREAPGDRERDKEEHFDMTEVAPVVTHHQISVDGKALKYTATAGRLPIKRADGKIEAEMFYVAYTLDGEDAAKRPL